MAMAMAMAEAMAMVLFFGLDGNLRLWINSVVSAKKGEGKEGEKEGQLHKCWELWFCTIDYLCRIIIYENPLAILAQAGQAGKLGRISE